jgi:hypothetical protein
MFSLPVVILWRNEIPTGMPFVEMGELGQGATEWLSRAERRALSN